MRRTAPTFVGGLEAFDWYLIYAHTHSGTVRIEWPDGGHYLAQCCILVEIWDMVTDEINKYRRENSK